MEQKPIEFPKAEGLAVTPFAGKLLGGGVVLEKLLPEHAVHNCG